MAAPLFFHENLAPLHAGITLDEDTSKHVVQVLRMQKGEQLQLTNGQGQLATATITDDHKKKCTVTIIATQLIERPARKTAIAISLLKNANRFEWFLEKATELGISEIIPLLCDRTERQHFRFDRMNSVLVSAMLQSQQSWLPKLHEPLKFDEGFFNLFDDAPQKFIAHCMDDAFKQNLKEVVDSSQDGVVLIGPEGDFTGAEVQLAMQHNYKAVALGNTRLRTETAGIVAATLLTHP